MTWNRGRSDAQPVAQCVWLAAAAHRHPPTAGPHGALASDGRTRRAARITFKPANRAAPRCPWLSVHGRFPEQPVQGRLAGAARASAGTTQQRRARRAAAGPSRRPPPLNTRAAMNLAPAVPGPCPAPHPQCETTPTSAVTFNPCARDSLARHDICARAGLEPLGRPLGWTRSLARSREEKERGGAIAERGRGAAVAQP